VTGILADTVLGAFVTFCRIGACLMLMPGFSSRRVPPKIRLFVAIALALALSPILSPQAEAAVAEKSPGALLRLLLSELLIGALIGFLGRLFFAALETLANVIALAIGLSSPLGGPGDEGDLLPSVASLITLAATVLFFLTDLHWEVLRGLVESYAALPIARMFDPRFGLVEVSDCFTKSFALALRISSPFIVYTLVVNLAVGLAAKLLPQIPIYFITVPAVVFGGLALLYATSRPFLEMFISGFAAWLVTG
jgi:flagellar biosynthetic protein FliR